MTAPQRFKPELLSPAGTLKNLRYAYAYGADAVYCGQPRYSLRVRNNDFKGMEALETGIQTARRLGKQIYIASNLSPHNDKVRTYLRDLEPVIELKPDALIMADPGLIMLVRERWPDMPIHLSVQANAVNYASVKFWKKFGLSRVILSRELSIEEVEDIHKEVPEMELEVFVHGALCIAYSGRCVLSGYMTHRDSNQGACTNSCRWPYKAHPAEEDATGDLAPLGNVQHWPPRQLPTQDQPEIISKGFDEPPAFLLEQDSRPGEFMPAYEDEHGTYIMNSKDLRAVQHVPRLVNMGIQSLKIEGRTKSHYYVARTAQVYRRAIDEAVAGREFDMNLMDELETLSNRGYTEGFYRRHPPAAYQNYEQGISTAQQQQFVGEVIDENDHWLTIDVKNRFAVGDVLQLMTPSGNISFDLAALENKQGEKIELAPGNGHIVRLPKPSDLQGEYGLLTRRV